MDVTVNGHVRSVPESVTVVWLVTHLLGRDPGGVAVALNGTVLPRQSWAQWPLQPTDRIDVIMAVQGVRCAGGNGACVPSGDVSVPVILLTDRHQAVRPLPDLVAAAVAGGLRMVIVREKDLPLARRIRLAGALREQFAPVGGRVLLAGGVPGPDGCHLAAADPWPQPAQSQAQTRVREEGPAQGLIGRSCHDLAELTAAAAAGAHYATLSPVFASTSKPGYGPALGLDDIRVLAAAVPLPVYALGGITSPAQARGCAQAGAAGVAVMGALMRAEDPAALTEALIAAVRCR